MKILLLILVLLLVLVIGFAVYVRIAPSDPAVWHVDPRNIGSPDTEGQVVVRPEGGDMTGPLFEATPETLLATFAEVADAAPRSHRLAGSLESGQITWIVRSALWGFPDYVSVRAVAVEGGARLAVFSRLRFGKGDMGVNRARIEDWIAQVQDRLPAR